MPVALDSFRNIRNTEGSALGWPSVQAVYLDDQLSGTIVTGNRFENCMTGVVLGGGRDNVVTFNHFENNDLAVHLDNRGMNWQLQVTARARPRAAVALCGGHVRCRTATTLRALWFSSSCRSTTRCHRMPSRIRPSWTRSRFIRVCPCAPMCRQTRAYG